MIHIISENLFKPSTPFIFPLTRFKAFGFRRRALAIKISYDRSWEVNHERGIQKRATQTVYDIPYHFVWVTNYPYHTIEGEVILKTLDLVWQTCEARSGTIISGHASKDHVHIHVSYRPGIGTQ